MGHRHPLHDRSRYARADALDARGFHRAAPGRPAGRVLHVDSASDGIFRADRGRPAIRAGGQGDRARLYDAAMGRDRRCDVPVGRHHAAARARDCFRPRGPRGDLQSADAGLARRQRAVRQRADPGGGVLLGRQHRLCPGAPLDLDAVSTRVLAGAAGGRTALGHRVDRGRTAPHRVERASFCAAALQRHRLHGVRQLGDDDGQSQPARRHDLAVPACDALARNLLRHVDPERAARTIAVSGDDVDHRRHRARDGRGRIRLRAKTRPNSPRNTSPCRSGRAGSAACPRTRRISWDRRQAARAGSR